MHIWRNIFLPLNSFEDRKGTKWYLSKKSKPIFPGSLLSSLKTGIIFYASVFLLHIHEMVLVTSSIIRVWLLICDILYSLQSICYNALIYFKAIHIGICVYTYICKFNCHIIKKRIQRWNDLLKITQLVNDRICV